MGIISKQKNLWCLVTCHIKNTKTADWANISKEIHVFNATKITPIVWAGYFWQLCHYLLRPRCQKCKEVRLLQTSNLPVLLFLKFWILCPVHFLSNSYRSRRQRSKIFVKHSSFLKILPCKTDKSWKQQFTIIVILHVKSWFLG